MLAALNLRSKIYLVLAGLSVLFVGVIYFFVHFEYVDSLRTELEKRGVSIARHIAEQNINTVLKWDSLCLSINLNHTMKTEKDIVYIFFLSSSGDVLGHTFGDKFPTDLLHVNPLPHGAKQHVRRLETNGDSLYDIVVPLDITGLGEVHLGLSALPVSQAVSNLTDSILWITLVCGTIILLMGLPLATAITRPLKELTQAADALAAGDFDHQVPVKSQDEIGILARTFNNMTEQLANAREELMAHNETLTDEVELRLAIEHQLDSQVNFLSILVNEIPDPFYYKDTNGVYLGCNRAFEEFLGRSKEQIIGHTVFDLQPEAEARQHDEIERSLLTRGGSFQYERSLSNSDGTARQIVIKKTSFRDRSGKLLGVIGLLLDVTREREIERLRREFTSTTAHEFLTPMTAIYGFCELLKQSPETTTPKDRSEYIDIIMERTESLSRLIDSFLDVGRIESGRNLPMVLHPCSMQNLVENTLRNVHYDEMTRFEISFPPNCPRVMADASRISQVIDNLLSNAVKYSPPQEKIHIRAHLEKDALRIAVEDHGPGMGPEHLEHIFEKFYRANLTESSPSGTGLGLFISRAIVEAHGGQISAHSAPGKGTRIEFTLPLA